MRMRFYPRPWNGAVRKRTSTFSPEGLRSRLPCSFDLPLPGCLPAAGSPAPVILDDGIVYTDDYRIERMFDALTRQAQDLQIIVFSCRQKAFRDLGGQALAIAPVAQEL